MITVALIIIILSLGYYYCVKPMSHWKERGVKQTSPVWLFGDLFKTTFRLLSISEWICRIYQQFPEERYFGFYQFSQPTLLIRDPELIKQITVKAFDHFVDHRSIMANQDDPLWNNNLAALKGKKWREMRPVLSPFFTSSKMKQMFVLMLDSARKFTDFFMEKNEDVVEVEFKNVFTKYCNDVIATTAFGIEVDSLRDQNNEFFLMGKEATSFTGFRKILKMLLIFILPKLAQILKIQFFDKDVRDFFFNLVDETVSIREQQHIVRPDLIHLLMQARKGKMDLDKESDEPDIGFSTALESLKGNVSHRQISNAEMASQAMIFFFGGFDSTSTLMCFLCYEMVANPSIQQTLIVEVDEAFAACDGKLTYDVLNKMKFLDMVVSETLRKWPNGLAIERECTKDYTIEPITSKEKPLNLTKGDWMWIPVFGIHRDEKYYPDPEKFDPERFSDENKGNINPLTYLPFGYGPRNCIGSRFALLESKVILFYILLHFEIVTTNKSKMPLSPGKGLFQLLPKEGFCFGLKKKIV